MKRKKLTRKYKAALKEKHGPDWKRKLKGRDLARELERVEIKGKGGITA